jgi:hypothetical protein
MRHITITMILVLSGCHLGPRIVGVGPDSVSIGYETRFVAEPDAVKRAKAYCRDRHRQAVFVSRKEDYGRVVLTYRCDKI